MTSTKLLLDCDPGLDDALALLLAHGDPEVRLVGVTTVGGNVTLEHTTRNALELREYLGFTDVPVSAGAAKPMESDAASTLREARDASEVHGERGLGNLVLPAATLSVSGVHAVDFIIETVRASPGTIDLVATGPLTNIALALARAPEIASLVKSFVIMGGSFTRGNATPAAEFNIYADPEAASIVFNAGWQVVMVGLDLTLQAVASADVIARMKALGPLGENLIAPLASFWVDPNDNEWHGQAVHDVCAVAYVTRPELFTSRAARVDVETRGTFTDGMTVVDFASPAPNAIVPFALDVPGFWDYVESSYALVAAQHPHA
ncbi:MAG: nucleoside hydrolase [Lacisediminihabitans sp.]